jgi:hypothetical protein
MNKSAHFKTPVSHVPYWLIFMAGLISVLMLYLTGVAIGWVSCDFNWLESDENKVAVETDRNTFTLDEEEWISYTNPELGFSLSVPVVTASMNGACDWVATEDETSFRLRAAAVPVDVLPDAEENTIYIVPRYGHEITVKDPESGGFTNCHVVINSLSSIKESYWQGMGWKIITREVATTAQLESFIQGMYGESCQLGEMTESTQTGVFDVQIDAGESEDPLAQDGCVVNYSYVLKYSPTKQRVVSFMLGQAPKFFRSYPTNAFDIEMIESFKFL